MFLKSSKINFEYSRAYRWCLQLCIHSPLSFPLQLLWPEDVSFPFFAQVRRRVSDNPLLHLFCYFLSPELPVGLISSALEHLSLFSKTSSFASFEFWKCFSETWSVKSAKLLGKVVIWNQTRSSASQCPNADWPPQSIFSFAGSDFEGSEGFLVSKKCHTYYKKFWHFGLCVTTWNVSWVEVPWPSRCTTVIVTQGEGVAGVAPSLGCPPIPPRYVGP